MGKGNTLHVCPSFSFLAASILALSSSREFAFDEVALPELSIVTHSTTNHDGGQRNSYPLTPTKIRKTTTATTTKYRPFIPAPRPKSSHSPASCTVGTSPCTRPSRRQ